ncbi:hypothetical protein [Rhodococcus pyridinivorans]|uniref:hypothetical protein n=1 Tax=Rhodococcus pyridinivorans TaxID=103816 RepID=UPI000BA2106E|nr:hypothetical protein [Rhodococcus pyridinivorans]
MINANLTLEALRDAIVDGILPKAFDQLVAEAGGSNPSARQIGWIKGRVDASLEILQTIDKDAYNTKHSEYLALKIKG